MEFKESENILSYPLNPKTNIEEITEVDEEFISSGNDSYSSFSKNKDKLIEQSPIKLKLPSFDKNEDIQNLLHRISIKQEGISVDECFLSEKETKETQMDKNKKVLSEQEKWLLTPLHKNVLPGFENKNKKIKGKEDLGFLKNELTSSKQFSERLSLNKPQNYIPRWNRRTTLDKLTFLNLRTHKDQITRQANTERSMEHQRETTDDTDRSPLHPFEKRTSLRGGNESRFKINLSEIKELQKHLDECTQTSNSRIAKVGFTNSKENTFQSMFSQSKKLMKDKPFSSQQLK